MLLDFIRQVSAQQNFKIKDDFKFVGLDDITYELMEKDEEEIQQLEIWTSIKTFYEGEIPSSYKALNFIISDWIETHKPDLTEIIHEYLKDHISEKYPGSDTSELESQAAESSIWEDQLDYMPRIDESEKSMTIEIELVVLTEPVGKE